MAVTASTRKSLTDLTRRKTRAVMSVLTLAIAVASVGIFAVPSLMQRAMDRQIASTHLADLTVSFNPLVIGDRQLRAIARTPNIVALQPKSVYATRIYVGDHRQKAVLIGVPSYARQTTDVIAVKSGRPPAAGALLTDSQNATKDKFEGGRGATVRVIGAGGRVRSLPVSGTGQFLGGGQLVADGNAVFYATSSTVGALTGTPGYTMLAMRLQDDSRAAATRTARAVRHELASVPGFTGYADYPEIRTSGDYPGKQLFQDVAGIMTLITFMALLSALVLLSNTMTTLIGEQTGEIAAMKAIGGGRRQIRRIYRRTALLLGGLGAIVGAALGVVLANLVVSFFASQFYGIDTGFQVNGAILAASVLVGVIGPPLAAWPAIRRAARLPVHEALSAAGPAVGRQGPLDRLTRHVGFLPRSAQIGLRSAVRRKRRSIATAVQISLAVGTLLAALSLGKAVGDMTTGFFNDLHFDVWVQTYASKPFDASAPATITSVPGVRAAQPVLSNNARVAGTDMQLWGLEKRPWYVPELTSGHWYTAAQARTHARVAVIGKALAHKAHVGVGGRIRAQTAAGPQSLRVIGISDNLLNQGAVAYLPLGTLQAALGTPGQINNYWVRTTTANHDAIDRITNRVEDALRAHGSQPTTQERYVMKRDSAAANASMTGSVTFLGLLIVLISLVGLVNAMTMGVIERTREIGVLRCVGARARDVRRIFRAEGLVVATAGWLIGVPLGWAMARGLIAITASIVSTDLTFAFPLVYVAITLAGTILLAVLVLIAPLRRAVRLRPGKALRYT